MPKRADLPKILIIGSGPIVIGQGAEFDYSGTQAAKALQEEGFEVVLVNSNPATIMTDPEFADRTYIEPVTPEYVELVIAKEKPDALLPTMGGQTALNVAMKLAERGVRGWKAVALEVMGDGADNVVIVCSIENIDAVRIHTGDSITVARAVTLTDREDLLMRDAAVAVIREIGVEAGGCNIQFAI